MMNGSGGLTLKLGGITGGFVGAGTNFFLKRDFEFRLIGSNKRIAADDVEARIFGRKFSDNLGVGLGAFTIKQNLTRTAGLLLGRLTGFQTLGMEGFHIFKGRHNARLGRKHGARFQRWGNAGRYIGAALLQLGCQLGILLRQLLYLRLLFCNRGF